MVTIEERAVACCMTKFPVHASADAESMRMGYIQGATDQRKIDIEKVIHALDKVVSKDILDELKKILNE